jgi:DNA-binding MarR family transcriptional regulator
LLSAIFGTRKEALSFLIVQTLERTEEQTLKITKCADITMNMRKHYGQLTGKILQLLEKEPGQSVKELAKRLNVNRTFLSGYLMALEDQGHLRSKEIGPAKIYFKKSKGGS